MFGTVSTSRRLSYVLSAFLICSIALNVAQSARLYRTQARGPKVQALRPGVTVPTVTVVDGAGKSSPLLSQDDPRPTVIYVTRLGCSWCVKNRNNIEFLAKNFQKAYRFLEVSLLDPGAKLSAREQNAEVMPTVGAENKRMRELYQITGTPQTYVVSAKGAVIKSWAGAYEGKNREEVEAFFGTKVPGLMFTQGAH
jgi:peroxiredoxin